MDIPSGVPLRVASPVPAGKPASTRAGQGDAPGCGVRMPVSSRASPSPAGPGRPALPISSLRAGPLTRAVSPVVQPRAGTTLGVEAGGRSRPARDPRDRARACGQPGGQLQDHGQTFPQGGSLSFALRRARPARRPARPAARREAAGWIASTGKDDRGIPAKARGSRQRRGAAPGRGIRTSRTPLPFVGPRAKGACPFMGTAGSPTQGRPLDGAKGFPRPSSAAHALRAGRVIPLPFAPTDNLARVPLLPSPGGRVSGEGRFAVLARNPAR